MSLGRKSKSSTVKIKTPPPITSLQYVNPLGDRYVTQTQGNQQNTQVDLSPFSQQLVSQSQAGLLDLTGQLDQSDGDRAAQIQQRGDTFYQTLASGINADANTLKQNTQSDLAQRFGGAYNATFGTDLLSRQDDARLGQLNTARQKSDLYAEDLANADEQSRLQRLGVFQGILGGYTNSAQSLASSQASLLSQDTNAANTLALQRASLLDRANAYSDEAAARQRQQLLYGLQAGLSSFPFLVYEHQLAFK